MNEMPTENQDAVFSEDRSEWIRPEVTRMRAGDAESSNLAALDSVAGLS